MSTHTRPAARLIWFSFVLAALVLLDLVELTTWAGLVTVTAVAIAVLVPAARPSPAARIDSGDMAAVAILYAIVVSSFWVAFRVFTTDNVFGLFVMFAIGLVIGVGGPVIYNVWIRSRDLRSLGIGLHQLPMTLAAGLTLAAVQFVVMFWGYSLPAPVDWVPLLVMSLVVGFFEAVFFRGFVQNRFEASMGTGPAVAAAGLLYSLYHVGYGMGGDEMLFLFALGVIYAIAFSLIGNILVLWPLLTPLGAFFNNVEAGDITLPWASIAGFADVAAAMGVVVWLAHRHVRRRDRRAVVSPEPVVTAPRHE
jgi:hypothetical protein